MLEKEIKILDIDQEKTIQILENLGAEKTFEWYIHDIYYDFEDWENQKMDQNKRLFRVRKKWDLHLYTIKRKRNQKSEWAEKWIKIADEAEYEITDVESFSAVLEKILNEKNQRKEKI